MDVCATCLGIMYIERNFHDLKFHDQKWLPLDDSEHQFVTPRSVTDKKKVILEAWDAGLIVRFGSRDVLPAVTTWRGDPICEQHLGDAVCGQPPIALPRFSKTAQAE